MLHQSWPPDEIVLIEDGPVSGSVHLVVEEYLRKYPEILRVTSLPENVGLGNALRHGVPLCANEWIARMDADDACELIETGAFADSALAYLRVGPNTVIEEGAVGDNVVIDRW